MDEARNYYEDYGRQEGFWIRTRSSSKTRLGSNEVTSRKFVCAHQGKYVTMNKSCDIEEEKNNKETRMNTIGRIEGINSFFDAFVTSKTNLKEFVVKYEQALKRIMGRESDEDFESEHKYRIVNDGEFLLKHAAQLYTRKVFNKFKDEWNEVNRYKVEERECDDEYHTYLVKTKFGEPEEFIVKLNLQNYKGMCECRNFDFVGILCRHVLKVFVRLDIDTIPEHFVLPRWKQEANKFRIMDSEDFVKNDNNEEFEALRLSHMCHQATKLAYTAASSKEKYIIYMEALNELSRKFSEVYEHEHPIDRLQMKDDLCDKVHSSQSLLMDPNVSQTKGRKKDVNNSKRIKSGIELSLNKKKRQCKLCEKYGHDK
ncbi:hypothetical protein LWI29_028654 [Acer saccharum]|uniref:Protein FAR1-RELATED SEQUENCE n=1 Tax=Acer saccharum TaxID=4024 RepID=A0AA39W9Z8_ACESA|nr:hypothetical protein LWI29_028654 [Acer saccharum]